MYKICQLCSTKISHSFDFAFRNVCVVYVCRHQLCRKCGCDDVKRAGATEEYIKRRENNMRWNDWQLQKHVLTLTSSLCAVESHVVHRNREVATAAPTRLMCTTCVCRMRSGWRTCTQSTVSCIYLVVRIRIEASRGRGRLEMRWL